MKKTAFFSALLILVSLMPAKAEDPTPQRVVGIGAAVTEIIYALEADDRLVGVDSQSVYPEEARALPQVGYVRQVAVEGLASLEPDLIIAAHDVGPPAAVERLRELGLHLIVTEPADDIASTARRIRAVGEALGLSEAASELAENVRQQAAATSARLTAPEMPRPSVALFLGRGAGSATAAGSDTVGDAMIRLAGGTNALESMNGFKAVPAESLIASAPEVVVVTTQMVEQHGTLEDVIRAVPGLRMTPAAKNGRIAAIDIIKLFSFGPRLPDAIENLGAVVHSGLTEETGWQVQP